jgi:hypothetical protein
MNDDNTRLVALVQELLDAMSRLTGPAQGGDVSAVDELSANVGRFRQTFIDAKTERMSRLLPAWFTERMANDVWAFGLLLTTGRILHIETILDVSQAADGSLWLDVRLGKQGDVHTDYPEKSGWPPLSHAFNDRDTCSVAVSQIVCAVELADT